MTLGIAKITSEQIISIGNVYPSWNEETPIRSDICIRANANHLEPIRKTFYNLFDEKRQKIDPTISDLIRGNNPNQSESTRARIDPNRIFNHTEKLFISIFTILFFNLGKNVSLRIFVSKSTKLYNNDMKLQRSS